MALMTDAVMVLFCDVADDPAGHDDWHTYEHMHERLSIPGFVRGTRWTSAASPRYLIVYEISGVEMARSHEYLERLNHPTPWTTETMKRLRGMTRGFCEVVAAAGYGLGHAAAALRFTPSTEVARERLAAEARVMAARKGMASVNVFSAADADAPMTTEQSIRGRDAGMGWMLLATAHDAEALRLACDEHLARLAADGIVPNLAATYELAFTATAAEVARTPANPPIRSPGCR